MTVEQLKGLCRTQNLKVSGKKALLHERLRDSVSSTANQSGDSSNGEPSATSRPSTYDRVVCIESNAKRTVRLRENLVRLGHVEESVSVDGDADAEAEAEVEAEAGSVAHSRAEIVVSYGQDWFPPTDATVRGVFLDVPCSATGLGKKQPDVLQTQICIVGTRTAHQNAKATNYAKKINALMELQHTLLTHVIDNVLEVGGVVVYSTCSVLKCESEDQINRVLNNSSGSKVEILPFGPDEIPGFGPDAIGADGFIRIVPEVLDGDYRSCDGFFVARLVKIALNKNRSPAQHTVLKQLVETRQVNPWGSSDTELRLGERVIERVCRAKHAKQRILSSAR
mmetsp:Transcript_44001/g.51539  ORF Transcript_44001/g.51539 Transcript_44001/m.51539 type:complete len:338 (+) Transcript_44001:857-1870(+)